MDEEKSLSREEVRELFSEREALRRINIDKVLAGESVWRTHATPIAVTIIFGLLVFSQSKSSFETSLILLMGIVVVTSWVATLQFEGDRKLQALRQYVDIRFAALEKKGYSNRDCERAEHPPGSQQPEPNPRRESGAAG